MRFISNSPYRDEHGKLTAAARQEAKRRGGAWFDAIKSQDGPIRVLESALDDHYILLLNSSLPNGTESDMILVGPNGIWVMQVVHGAGMYKVEGDVWLAYNHTNLTFEPAEELSPIDEVRNVATTVYDHLHASNLPVPWANSLLIVTSADANVQTTETAVRVLTVGDLNRFVMQDILALEPVMSVADIAEVIDSLQPLFAQSKPALGSSRRFLGMTGPQLAIIAVMALLDVCMLCGLGYVVLSDSLF